MCRVVGPPDRVDDFLCELCAHPDEIRTFCASCGDRQTLVPTMGLELLATLFPEVPHSTGTAIRLEQCPRCASAGAGLGRVTVHRIRANAPQAHESNRPSIEVAS